MFSVRIVLEGPSLAIIEGRGMEGPRSLNIFDLLFNGRPFPRVRKSIEDGMECDRLNRSQAKVAG